MRRMFSSLALALTLNAGIAAPAWAGGDWGYGSGVNPYGVATPVPAPVPVPVYDAQWYFRIDVGAGMGGDPSVSTTGAPFGTGLVPAVPAPFGFDANWLSTNYDAMFTATGGIGYIWGPHLRTDFTVDLRSLGDVTYNGSQLYTDAGGADRLVTVSDKTEMNSVPLLINGYYDFFAGKSLRPYLGAGIGFSVNRLHRNNTSTDVICVSVSPCVPAGGITTTANESNYNISLAAAAMVGLTYDWSSYTAIDLNYRYMYIGGSDANLRINGVNTSVKIGDINEHQVRVGLRFNVH
ncbi:MAG: outer membrane beta-barrel protein [Hyphomicrobiaceae bacterium]|nr:outer membrane beta-barrel protein [Hyphomicrobiaceae bacterium]